MHYSLASSDSWTWRNPKALLDKNGIAQIYHKPWLKHNAHFQKYWVDVTHLKKKKKHEIKKKNSSTRKTTPFMISSLKVSAKTNWFECLVKHRHPAREEELRSLNRFWSAGGSLWKGWREGSLSDRQFMDRWAAERLDEIRRNTSKTAFPRKNFPIHMTGFGCFPKA